MGVLIFIALIGILIQVWICVACANIAKRKGYDAAIGVLIGFFLGVIGIIILYLIPDKEPYYSPRMGAPRGAYHNTRHSHRPPLNPRGRVNTRRPMSHGPRSGYRPVKNSQNNYEEEVPMQAIPKNSQAVQVACPHCNTVLEVTEHMEYTCPNCQNPFIY